MAERYYQNEGIYILNPFKEKKRNNHCHCHSDKNKIKNELKSLTKNIPISELSEILNNIKYNLKK